MKHIRITSGDGETWCGVILTTESAFLGAESAALHGKYHGDDNVCGVCIDAVVESLNLTREPHEPESTS